MELEDEIKHLKNVLSEIRFAYGDEKKYYDVLSLLRKEKVRFHEKGETKHGSYYWYLDVTEGDEADGYMTLGKNSNSKEANYGLYKDFLDNFKMDVERELLHKEVEFATK